MQLFRQGYERVDARAAKPLLPNIARTIGRRCIRFDPGRLGSASILLHCYRHLPRMHIESQLHDPLDSHDGLVATTARYYLIIHNSRQFTAGAVCSRLMSSDTPSNTLNKRSSAET